MGPRDGFRLRGIVHVHEDLVGVVVAEEGVGVVTAEEVHRAAGVDHVLGLSPLEECPCIVVKLSQPALRDCLSAYIDGGGGTAFLGEQINLVAFPAAREIHPQLAVALVGLAGGESHLVTVENLRDSTDCGQKGVGDLQLVRILPPGVGDTIMIVVGEEYQHLGHIVIGCVVREG